MVKAAGTPTMRPHKDARSLAAGLPDAIRVTQERRAFAVCCALLGVAAIWFLSGFITARLQTGWQSFGDFPAIWSYGRIALTHPAALLYDFEGLHTAQVALGLDPQWHYPFPYPPPMLLLLRLFGLLPYEPALVTWIAVQLGFYLWAVLGDDGNRVERLPLSWPVRLAMAAALLLAPTATLTIVEGQSGFLAAGLLVGGIRRAERRPLLGGLLLGLLTYKPQLGLLVPVALLAAGWWRCAVATCLTIGLLVIVSSAAFGWDIWLLWFRSLPDYQAWFNQRTHLIPFMPTVAANLQSLGVPVIVARGTQMAALLLAACATWRCFRTARGSRTLAIAALIAATCLANPHGFVYDLPMLDAAVVLLVTQRLRSGAGVTVMQGLLMLAVLLFPAAMVMTTMPFGFVILAGFLAMIMALQSRLAGSQTRATVN